MEESEYEEIKRHLLTAFNLCAPSGDVQNTMVKYIHDMERDEPRLKARIRMIVGSLYDGLAYGNWPGTDYAKHH